MNVTGSAAVNSEINTGVGLEIPDHFDVVIRSYHEGPVRKYACALTPALSQPPVGAAIAHDSIEAAVAAALLNPTPVVDGRFWAGLKVAFPASLLLWGILIGLGFALWKLG